MLSLSQMRWKPPALECLKAKAQQGAGVIAIDKGLIVVMPYHFLGLVEVNICVDVSLSYPYSCETIVNKSLDNLPTIPICVATNIYCKPLRMGGSPSPSLAFFIGNRAECTRNYEGNACHLACIIKPPHQILVHILQRARGRAPAKLRLREIFSRYPRHLRNRLV